MLGGIRPFHPRAEGQRVSKAVSILQEHWDVCVCVCVIVCVCVCVYVCVCVCVGTSPHVLTVYLMLFHIIACDKFLSFPLSVIVN